LPFVQNEYAKVFGSFVFTLNPFVYSRMLAGQWLLLFGYSLLPLVLGYLMKFTDSPSKKHALQLGISLTLLGLFSIHLLFISCLLSVIWIIAFSIKNRSIVTIKFSLISLIVFLALNLFWILPSLERRSPIESEFNQSHFEVFSASGNDSLGVLLNTALLGGFWGEGTAWKYYFVWPQDNLIFLESAFLILILALGGLIFGVKDPDKRFKLLLLLAFALAAYVTGLGASDTVFYGFNLFLYEHFPSWEGMRDSQKILGFLALIYALFAGLGYQWLTAQLDSRRRKLLSICIFCLPMFFGIYLWSGFHGALRPIWYPKEWFEVETLLENNSVGDDKVLVLPWHGYISLDFANQLVVSNPAPSFFGENRVIASKNIEFGDVYDQESDPSYREIDRAITSSNELSEAELEHIFKKNGIKYLLIIKNSAPQKDIVLQPKIESSKYFALTLFQSDLLVLKSTGQN